MSEHLTIHGVYDAYQDNSANRTGSKGQPDKYTVYKDGKKHYITVWPEEGEHIVDRTKLGDLGKAEKGDEIEQTVSVKETVKDGKNYTNYNLDKTQPITVTKGTHQVSLPAAAGIHEEVSVTGGFHRSDEYTRDDYWKDKSKFDLANSARISGQWAVNAAIELHKTLYPDGYPLNNEDDKAKITASIEITAISLDWIAQGIAEKRLNKKEVKA